MATITADLTTGYGVEITNGRHVWKADEPIDLGGDDTSPNPYEMMLGALAAGDRVVVRADVGSVLFPVAGPAAAPVPDIAGFDAVLAVADDLGDD